MTRPISDTPIFLWNINIRGFLISRICSNPEIREIKSLRIRYHILQNSKVIMTVVMMIGWMVEYNHTFMNQQKILRIHQVAAMKITDLKKRILRGSQI